MHRSSHFKCCIPDWSQSLLYHISLDHSVHYPLPFPVVEVSVRLAHFSLMDQRHTAVWITCACDKDDTVSRPTECWIRGVSCTSKCSHSIEFPHSMTEIDMYCMYLQQLKVCQNLTKYSTCVYTVAICMDALLTPTHICAYVCIFISTHSRSQG